MLEKKALYNIFGEDKTILVTGSKGDGKTNLASIILQTLAEILGYDSWTNIHYFKIENVPIAIAKNKLPKIPGLVYMEKPQRIHVVKSLSEVLLGIVDSAPNGKAFILDEGGIHADSSIATSKDTRTIKQLNRIIRHFECCFIIITQTKGSVPPDLREKDVDYHFKMKKTRFGYLLDIGKKKVEVDEITGDEKITFPSVKTVRVPPTKYPYDGKFPTGFNIDINLKEALDRLSEVGDSVEMMDNGEGREILLGMIDDKKKKQKYLSTGQYAKKYGFHPHTIRTYCKKGRINFITTNAGQLRIIDKPPML